MESQFRSLDVAIQSQPMPPEFRDTKAIVLCNDCCAKSTTMYHWLGLKCVICLSYNTVELQILGGNAQGSADQPETGASSSAQAEPGQDNHDGPSSEQASAAITVRRRYSSHNYESRYNVDPRLARSMSPGLASEIPLRLIHRTAEEDSDDDILGFWSRDSGDDSDALSGDHDGEFDADSDYFPDLEEEDEDDDDDDDSDDDILLIGHR